MDMQPAAASEMAMDDVLWFLALMDDAGVEVWLDGGWAVDACLGTQTRRHGDLDIAVEEHHVAALTRHGFAPVARDDTRAWNFVLGDSVGRQVDFHVVVLADDGRGVYGPAVRCAGAGGRSAGARGDVWRVASRRLC